MVEGSTEGTAVIRATSQEGLLSRGKTEMLMMWEKDELVAKTLRWESDTSRLHSQ